MPFLESKWLNDLEDHGANWVILAQICDELPHGKTEFPRILESKWPKYLEGHWQWPPICNTNWQYLMMHVWCKFGCSSSYMWRVIVQTRWSLRTDGRTGHWLLFGNFWIHHNDGQRLISTLHLKQCLCTISQMKVRGPYWRYVNIGSGNGLVPSGKKPLPEPMLTQIDIAIWRH